MKKIFAANWKLHKTPQETREFFKVFLPQVRGLEAELLFFPSASSWEATAESLGNSENCKWGAQNIWYQGQGAFTGENSALVLSGMGAGFALVGHSERRQLFAEPAPWMKQKVAYLQSLQLVPVLCIGETLQERDSHQTKAVVEGQLREGLADADLSRRIIVAYEPVWAIGTGQVARPDQVAEVHRFLYSLLKGMGAQNFALLYGGSVKPDHASDLLALPHVDGFLVGGASLEPVSFLGICEKAEASSRAIRD